jgi:F-type H+-transporting ATPase subunit b
MDILKDPNAWVAISFLLFFLLLGAKIFPALLGALDKRAAGIKAEIEEANRLRREAETMLEDAKAKREAALAEAEAMVANAKNEAARLAREAEVDLAAATARREKQATDRIAAAEAQALADVRRAAADAAITAAREVIAKGLGAQHTALIEDAIGQLPSRMRAA